MIKQMGELEKLPINRYQAVMIASKRARALNQKLKRQKEAAMITPDLVDPEIDEKTKITVQAMQDPQVADLFPVWRYAGIRDGRQRPEHEAHFDKYFANATAFAEVRDSIKHSPWNCRCNPVPVSKFAWRRLQQGGAKISSVVST